MFHELTKGRGRPCARVTHGIGKRLHDLVVFDSLEAMSERWGADTAQRFFTLSCPLLLELGAIAYWSLAPRAHSQAMRREIEGVTQCVVALQYGRLRVAKAEGRPPGIEGSVFRYRVEEGAFDVGAFITFREAIADETAERRAVRERAAAETPVP